MMPTIPSASRCLDQSLLFEFRERPLPRQGRAVPELGERALEILETLPPADIRILGHGFQRLPEKAWWSSDFFNAANAASLAFRNSST
jgi:hypothetical protein